MQKRLFNSYVSIVAPTLNQKSFLTQTLDSLFINKLYSPFEVIVLDGFSVDGTRDIFQKIAYFLKK
jgi:glycosyltransferase involved in cell wall biosynthesis